MPDRKFITTFVVQGVGGLRVAGRHSVAFETAIKAQQRFLRLYDGDNIFIIPTALILLCGEGMIDDTEADPNAAPTQAEGSGDEGGALAKLGLAN